MPCIDKNLVLPMIFWLTALTAACEPLLTPADKVGTAPTPLMRFEAAGTDDLNIFVEQQPFQVALLQAIPSRDEAKLKRTMAKPFFNGMWRGEMRDLTPSDVLRELYETQLGDEIQLALTSVNSLLTGTERLFWVCFCGHSIVMNARILRSA